MIPCCNVVFIFRILGQRVAELEKKLKTLEISGLWNLPPGKLIYFTALIHDLVVFVIGHSLSKIHALNIL